MKHFNTILFISGTLENIARRFRGQSYLVVTFTMDRATMLYFDNPNTVSRLLRSDG